MDEIQNSNFVCVECGKSQADLFKKHSSGIIKVSFCECCQQAVDKYILCDPVIVLLDALLHKPQVYRHLLHNTVITSSWKLLLIFLFCDTYLKWDGLHSDRVISPEGNSPIFYAAMEVDFYWMFGISVIESLCYILVALGLFKVSGKVSTPSGMILQAIVLSSFGKLLTIPAIIWAQTHSTVYLWLTKLFVFTSNFTALKVLCSTGVYSTVTVVTFAWLAQYWIGRTLQQYIWS